MPASRRNILHRRDLEAFVTFMKYETDVTPGKGEWELLVWFNGQRKKCAIYNNLSSPEHLSCSYTAIPYVQRFIQKKREAQNEKT